MIRRRYQGVSVGTALVAVAVLLNACASMAAGTPSVDIVVGTAAGEVLEFSPADVDAAAAPMLGLSFTNQSTLPHNLVFLDPIAARTTDIVDPGTTERLDVTIPGAGTYRFVCTIHDAMTGTLTVR